MTFQQLYYLLEVEKTGSFSMAAKKMFVTQSTISNAVAGLEKEVGSPIFVRGKKALTLTPEGMEIIAHAKRICESHKYITTGEHTQKPVFCIGSNGFSPVRKAFVQLVEENKDLAVQYAIRQAPTLVIEGDEPVKLVGVGAIRKFIAEQK